MKLLVRTILLPLAVALLLVGCVSKESGPSSTKDVSLKVGYVPIGDCLPLYVAKEKGIFSKHGLNVEMIPLQSGQRIIEALVGRSVDVGISNVVSTCIAHSKGVPVTAFTGGPLETTSKMTKGLIVLNDSPIRSAKDLEGKTIAVNGLRNIEHVMLRRYLQKNNIEESKVKVVELPFPQMEGALTSHTIDAAMETEPFITMATQRSVVRIVAHPYTEVQPRVVVSCYDGRTDWLDGNSGTARKFSDSIAEATEFIAKNDSEARSILAKYTKLEPGVADKVVIPEFAPHFAPSDFEPWINELVRQQILTQKVQPGEIFRAL